MVAWGPEEPTKPGARTGGTLLPRRSFQAPPTWRPEVTFPPACWLPWPSGSTILTWLSFLAPSLLPP